MTLDEWLTTPIHWTISASHVKVDDHWIRGEALPPSGERLLLAIGDFPEENLFTLLVDGVVVGGFNSWPNTWTPKLDVWPRGTDNPPKCPHCGK